MFDMNDGLNTNWPTRPIGYSAVLRFLIDRCHWLHDWWRWRQWGTTLKMTPMTMKMKLSFDPA